MDIINLTEQSTIYTSNVWYCSCNGSKAVSGTLIDTGCDASILNYLQEKKKQTGRNPIDQIILTHNHYDHAKLLNDLKKEYNPVVFASSSYTSGIDKILMNGTVLMCGDYHLEIIAIPGHTSDSICIYCPEEEILFSGDTPLIIWGTGNTYEKSFLAGFEELAKKKIQAIYPGHGEVMKTGVMNIIRQSLINLKNSRILD